MGLRVLGSYYYDYFEDGRNEMREEEEIIVDHMGYTLFTSSNLGMLQLEVLVYTNQIPFCGLQNIYLFTRPRKFENSYERAFIKACRALVKVSSLLYKRLDMLQLAVSMGIYEFCIFYVRVNTLVVLRLTSTSIIFSPKSV